MVGSVWCWDERDVSKEFPPGVVEGYAIVLDFGKGIPPGVFVDFVFPLGVLVFLAVFSSGGVGGFCVFSLWGCLAMWFWDRPKTGAKRGGKPLPEYFRCHILHFEFPGTCLRCVIRQLWLGGLSGWVQDEGSPHLSGVYHAVDSPDFT
nr:hypothetical protein [Providencia rettgeri]